MTSLYCSENIYSRFSSLLKCGETCARSCKFVLLYLLCALSLICSARSAFAKPEFPPIVEKAYNLKSGGNVDKATLACNLCHVAAGPPQLNAYGTDVKGALKSAQSKTLTSDILHSIDKKDSDGDGFTNGAEFAADTLPGDPNSKPAGKPDAATKSAADNGSGSGVLGQIEALVFPKHAQHPLIVHFPIALFIVSLLFDVLALRKYDPQLARAGFFNLLVAAISSLGAVVSGLLAWWFKFDAMKLQGTILNHLLLGILTTVLLWLLLFIRLKQKDKTLPLSKSYFVLALINLLVISITGHLGGNLSGVNG